ncbi:hypothetical protein NHX12_016877, partial [Muraenolepis orangiensis]
ELKMSLCCSSSSIESAARCDATMWAACVTGGPSWKLWGGYVYLLFMAVALTALWVTWFRMPETRGRSFDNIAEEFHGARAEFK